MSVMINSPYIVFFFNRFQVMKTCKRLGIKTVAIYSEADANAVCFDKFLRILIFAGVIHTVLVKMLNKCSVYSCLIKSFCIRTCRQHLTAHIFNKEKVVQKCG